MTTAFAGLSATAIVENIRCDLKDGRDGIKAINRGPATFLTEGPEWNAAIELTLNVVAESNGNGGAGNDIPYVPQTATLALATNVTGTADRQVGYKFTVALGAKDPIDCKADEVGDRRKHNSKLVGDLGIGVWLAQLQDAYAETKTKPESVSYVLGFTLLQSAEASVRIVKIPFNSAAANLGLGWKGSWKDVNKISIVFAPKPTPAPTISKTSDQALAWAARERAHSSTACRGSGRQGQAVARSSISDASTKPSEVTEAQCMHPALLVSDRS
ncbi:hypothetical protein ACWGS9_33085 [Bradyrhizobium sp. Arg314]